MKQFLTEQQANELYDKLFDEPAIAQYSNEIEGYVAKVLNELSIKPFPEFEVPYCLLRIKYDKSNGSHFIRLELGSLSAPDFKKWLDKDEFKQFAKGVAKINEWLEQLT